MQKAITINSKEISLLKPITSADYKSKTILTDSAWEYVELWFKRQKDEKSKKEFEAHLTGMNNKKIELHSKEEVDEILKDIDNENAGRYRKENVTIKGATHIPPDYLKVPELMEKLILTYNTWSEYHPIIQAALLHGELVKIHPFVDGNGRTSRLLMNLVLMNNGYNPVIIKKESRLKYYEALDKAHTTGNYTDFVKLVTKLEIEMLKKYLELL